MSKIVIAVFAFCALFIGGGCTSDEENLTDYLNGSELGAPVYNYYLNFRFEDEKGSDMLDGIEVYGIGYLKSGSYSLIIGLGDSESVKIEDLCLAKDTDGKYYMPIYASYTMSGFADNYDMEFRCDDIFGDSKTHKIRSKWVKDKYTNKCTEVTVDGVNCVFKVVEEYHSNRIPGATTYWYDVTVKVDRL